MPTVKKTERAADIWDAVTDIVIAQREAQIKAEQAQMAVERARFEAERLAEQARIAAERDWLGASRESEQARLAAERARIEAERLAMQALLGLQQSRGKNTGDDGFAAESETSRKNTPAAKGGAKRRCGKKGAESAFFSEEAAAGLVEAFKQCRLNFTMISHNRRMMDYEHDITSTVDVFLENNECAMAVATAVALKRQQVDDHVECMKKIRRYAGVYGDRRQFFGALAAARIDDDTRKYALEQGFYIIEGGANVTVTAPV